MMIVNFFVKIEISEELNGTAVVVSSLDFDDTDDSNGSKNNNNKHRGM